VTRGVTADSPLACCHGFAVTAGDAFVGVVETPVFTGTRLEPESLVVRTGSGAGSFRVVPAALVAGVDAERQTVTLGATVEELERLDPATAGVAATGARS